MVESESPPPPLRSDKLNDVEKNGADGQVVGTGGKTDITVDAVWGDIGADGPNYRNLGWQVCSSPNDQKVYRQETRDEDYMLTV